MILTDVIFHHVYAYDEKKVKLNVIFLKMFMKILILEKYLRFVFSVVALILIVRLLR